MFVPCKQGRNNLLNMLLFQLRNKKIERLIYRKKTLYWMPLLL